MANTRLINDQINTEVQIIWSRVNAVLIRVNEKLLDPRNNVDPKIKDDFSKFLQDLLKIMDVPSKELKLPISTNGEEDILDLMGEQDLTPAKIKSLRQAIDKFFVAHKDDLMKVDERNASILIENSLPKFEELLEQFTQESKEVKVKPKLHQKSNRVELSKVEEKKDDKAALQTEAALLAQDTSKPFFAVLYKKSMRYSDSDTLQKEKKEGLQRYMKLLNEGYGKTPEERKANVLKSCPRLFNAFFRSKAHNAIKEAEKLYKQYKESEAKKSSRPAGMNKSKT